MAEEQVNQAENTQFTRGGSALNNISLSQARVLAVRTAQANPGRRRWILRRRMFFEVLSDHEEDDGYTVVVSFRPEEDFPRLDVLLGGDAGKATQDSKSILLAASLHQETREHLNQDSPA